MRQVGDLRNDVHRLDRELIAERTKARRSICAAALRYHQCAWLRHALSMHSRPRKHRHHAPAERTAKALTVGRPDGGNPTRAKATDGRNSHRPALGPPRTARGGRSARPAAMGGRCTMQVRALYEELRHPMNVHRWRKLEGSDPSAYEMIQKIQTLQKRLIAKTEEVTARMSQPVVCALSRCGLHAYAARRQGRRGSGLHHSNRTRACVCARMIACCAHACCVARAVCSACCTFPCRTVHPVRLRRYGLRCCCMLRIVCWSTSPGAAWAPLCGTCQSVQCSGS